MHLRILGSAAGGGLPQWNCGCANCRAARGGSKDVLPRTQSSLAVSADGDHWFLLNVSPDVRQQMAAFSALAPASGQRRQTPLAGCVLTDAEMDHTCGLLLLREGLLLPVFSTATVKRWLTDHFPLRRLLAPFADRPWSDLPLDAAYELPLPSGQPSGLRLRCFETDRHVPQFVEEATSDAQGSVIGLVIEDMRGGAHAVYAPCVAAPCEALTSAVQGASALLVDGTFWDDEEPLGLGIGSRTARQMGHWPVSGSEGSLAWLTTLAIEHRVYVHINNTNPMLNRSSTQSAAVHEQGVLVGYDGWELEI
jgi:pyrroloquinoline quinone biosynthesis protein B